MQFFFGSMHLHMRYSQVSFIYSFYFFFYLWQDDNYVYSSIWANRRDVQEALHIPEVCSSQRVLLLIFNLIIYDTFHGHQELNGIEWVRCNETLVFSTDTEPISYTHNVISAVSYHRKLIDKHCRALVYRCYSSSISFSYYFISILFNLKLESLDPE